MNFTKIVHPDIFDDPNQYEKTDTENIYKKLEDGYFVAAIEYVLESDEDTQYPMEDVLDKLLVHIEAFKVATPTHPQGQVDVFSSSDLDRLVKMTNEIVGKRVYNVPLTENGQEVVDLIIDDSVDDAKI